MFQRLVRPGTRRSRRRAIGLSSPAKLSGFRGAARTSWGVLCALALAAGSACQSADEYRAQADQSTYAILTERRHALGFVERPFSIDPLADSLRGRVLAGEVQQIGPLSLTQCLEIAAENSREFQDQREALYISALDLTLERWAFDTQYGAGLAGLLSGVGSADTASLDASGGLTRVLGNGARIVSDLGLSLTRDLASGGGWDLTSNLFLGITQPLLRGAGERIVMEPLTQAERDVVYSVREYERFRRRFAVDVANRFYRLLQDADELANEEENFKNLGLLLARNEALGEAGRLDDIEVDQARQDQLRSLNTLIDLRQSVQTARDDFKVFLGLPISIEIELDDGELDRLASSDPGELAYEEELVLALALEQRLDYKTVLDRRDDAERKVYVAADALRAGLGLVSTARISSAAGSPADYDIEDLQWTLGFDFELPLDRVAERNAYRGSLIALEQRRRDVDEVGDTIQADVRQELGETRTNLEAWRIQKNAEALAERRVESTKLKLEAGRAATRDILEAQEDRVAAQNASTQALIDFQIARLALWRDLEMLRVEDQGIQVEPALEQRLVRSEP